MKKLYTVLFAILAMILLSPQKGWATPDYIKIKNTTSSGISVSISLVGSWTDADVANLNLYYSTNNGSKWTQSTKRGSTSLKNGKYYAYGTDCTVRSDINANGVMFKCKPTSALLATLGKDKYYQIGLRGQVSITSGCTVTGNVMTMVYGDSADYYTSLPNDYCFYKLFTPTDGKNAAPSSTYQIDFSGVVLPAVELRQGCYESMFEEMGSHMNAGPTIKALSPSSCDATDCFKNMFNGCSNLTSLTAYFLDWGDGTSTSNWITSTKSITFNCPSSLAETKDASHMGSNGSKSATVTPIYYVFDVATNGGTWDGTCAINKYATTAAPTISDPQGFSGWFDAASGGNPVTLANLTAPSEITTYYAQFGSTCKVTINTPDNGTLTVKIKGTDTEVNSGDELDKNTILTCTVEPATGYVFGAWTGDAAAEVTLTGDVTLGATFVEKSYSVTIPSVDNGTITATDGTHNYAEGQTINNIAKNTTLTFTAIPDEHYDFKGWTYALAEQAGSNPYTGTLTIVAATPAETTVSATFEIQHFTISTAVNDANKGSVTGAGTYDYNTNATLTATANIGQRFVQWNDANTDNPRIVNVTESKTFTAEFVLESENKAVNAYQVSTADTTKILYALTPVTKSGITYTPIDLGYGVAWCDRNLGASSANAVGSWYNWGGSTVATTFDKTTYSASSPIVDINANADFGTAYDAAYTLLGTSWRVPSKTDLEALVANTTYSNHTFTSKINAATIYIPASGYKDCLNSGTIYKSSNAEVWSRTKLEKNTSFSYNNYAYYLKDGAVISSTSSDNRICGGQPIRPIYQPSYTIYTLTVNVGTHSYVYKCQSGQTITVTALADEANGYAFSSWTGSETGSNATIAVTMSSDKTITANFSASHTVTIARNNESYGTVSASSVANVPHGTVITTQDNKVTINGTEVTATANTSDAQYTYAFTGWTNGTETVNSDITVTANFTRTLNQYTITFKNGETTLQSGLVNYGTTPTYSGATPSKDEDDDNTYEFKDWGGELKTVTKDTTYIATFTATPKSTIFELVDDKNSGDTYYTTLLGLDGQTKDVRYVRTFAAGTAAAPSWSIFSLPFNYFIDEEGQTFYGKVLDLDNAEYNDGVVTLNFVYETYQIKANQPYVLYNTGDAIENPEFANVTFAAQEVNSYDVDCTPSGTVTFYNTLCRQQLTANDVTTVFITNNQLYHPGSSTYMRAFRGYFKLNDILPSSAPRRIELRIDETTGLSTEMQPNTTTQKYFENGILIIERNGVRYNAQGTEIK